MDPWVGKIPRRRERLPTPVFLVGAGAVASWGSSDCEEIRHVQDQRNPSKMGGARVAVRRYPTSKVRETPVRWEALEWL